MIVLRVIARLLDYPDQELFDHHVELIEALKKENELNRQHCAGIAAFIKQFCTRSLLDAQAEYGELFDRGRATSLLLFEHVHGESRDRGQAMVDLLEQYRADGLELDSRELPDFLPLYLEYLAASGDVSRAINGLRDIMPILALLRARLQQRQSPYAGLFDALLSLSGEEVTFDSLHPQVAKEARDDTPQALDAVWEEEQVKFFGEQGCIPAQQAAHQRRFVGAVTPQYLDVAQATSRPSGS